MKSYDYIKKCVEVQKNLCKQRGTICFIDSDGVCFHCHRNIFDEGGLDIVKAGKDIITGCPYCKTSFVD